MAAGTLSLPEARRVALAAQGFDRPRPAGRVDVRHVRGTIRRLGLLQIDYVNVVVPSHYQVLYSRLGPYRRAILDDLVHRRREFTEQWAHVASIVPVEQWPLLAYRREAAAERSRPLGRRLRSDPDYLERMLREVKARGPVCAGDLPGPEGAPRRIGGWWGTIPKVALEAHFAAGRLAVAGRKPDFTRVYDLTERVVPATSRRRRVAPGRARRELLRIAARAHGVGSAADLADYYRMPMSEARRHLAELVAGGELREVAVEGWREPAYLSPTARVPRRIDAAALLSPFDPVVWHRPRGQRLFDFDYRLEIFVPEAKRRWGTYVLPFLMGDRLVARVDARAERRGGILRVPAAFLERGADPDVVAPALAAELRSWSDWLDLGEVRVGRRGSLARALAEALRG